MSTNQLEVTVASGDSLDVRQFGVQDGLSKIFNVTLTAVSRNANLDFDSIVGQDASFRIKSSAVSREWHGLCSNFLQVGVEDTGVSTYQITIVPTLWLLTQRRNHRIFQQMSEIEITQKILGEWGIDPDMKLDASKYKKRKYKVQYAETDFDFIARSLEDVGVTFYFSQEGSETKLVLSDAPQTNDIRPVPLPFVERPNHGESREHVTNVTVHQRVRPGKFTVFDHDYRLPPTYKLKGEATNGQGIENKLERFHYDPGAFLFRSESGESTPHADDRGKTRSDENEASNIATRRLAAKRSDSKRTTFHSNAMDIAPGHVLRVLNHPRGDVADAAKHLIVEVGVHGDSEGELQLHAEAHNADLPYYPPEVTPQPKIQGVESATVVGPQGEEIHVDEFGRIRVQFHWDREGQYNQDSSCWIHVSQPWGGSGYGATSLPRVGQEVLVDFLGGDPDRPIVTGRVYTNIQKTPYKLPDNKTQSGWKSNSTGHTGGYNEVFFEDLNGKELLRFQAQKDMHTLVKNNHSRTIIADSTAFTGGNNVERVNKKETITVTDERSITVMSSQTHTVKTDITQTAQEGNTTLETKQTFKSHADKHMISSDSLLVISVGGASTIVITPTSIVLNAPKVYINPGPDAVNAAINGQPMPLSDSDKEAQEFAAKQAQQEAEDADNREAAALASD